MPHIFTIPSTIDFIGALAEGVWRECENDVFRLADMQIFLPTRRACLLLREAFLNRLEGQAALLPRMRPLGDVDDEEFYFSGAAIDPDIPEAISPLRRKLQLTRLVAARDKNMSYDQAAQLADALAKLLDEAQIYRLDFSNLDKLVEEQDLAEHWQQTVRFLDILVKQWPEILAAEGCIDPVTRRNRVMETQIAAWRAKPPAFPIIAAGSTGSIPATADFLAAIAALPHGRVVLPGLDTGMNEEAWQAVDDGHPQHAMKNLLEVMGIQRTNVKPWLSLFSERPARHRLFQETMRPAAVTEAWRELTQADIPPEALKGLSYIELDHTQEEAQVIALIMRSVLNEPTKTAALVTPDRQLAERVTSMLSRWNIEANDSGGSPLAARPIGGFLTAVLGAAKPNAGSVDWLSLLKHPLTAFGVSTAECRAQARQIEIHVWRTDRPEESPWLEQIKKQMENLAAHWREERPFVEWLESHIALSERIATTDEQTGAARLWSHDDGEQAAEWLNDLRGAARNFPSMSGEDYAAFFTELLHAVIYRPRFGFHPRLSILGLLEARLAQADVVILGGLNEASWPPEIPADPWMSRPMRKSFGFPAPEYRISLAAHDFAQLGSAPEVIMTRSRRAGNSPTVPSRFLLQMQTVLQAVGIPENALEPETPWRVWARMLDEPSEHEMITAKAPEPRPDVKFRPRELSVTEISTWQRNPYAIYAKHILKLRKLDPLDASLDASDRGRIIHDALDQFSKKFPNALPPNALEELRAIGQELFSPYAEHPEIKAFWWPRFERIAAWFVDYENERRAKGSRLLSSEVSGRVVLDGFTIKGRADRIDRLPDGTLAIVDYKTGGAPTDKLITQGIEPQLPLLGLIAARGGFGSIPAAATSELWYWKMSGGRKAADPHQVNGDTQSLIAEAEEGLKNLVAAFADPATPYQAVPKPALAPHYDDYAHLARLKEWGRTEGE